MLLILIVDADEQRVFLILYRDDHLFAVIVLIARLVRHDDNDVVLIHHILCHRTHLFFLVVPKSRFYWFHFIVSREGLSTLAVQKALQDEDSRHLVNDLLALAARDIGLDERARRRDRREALIPEEDLYLRIRLLDLCHELLDDGAAVALHVLGEPRDERLRLVLVHELAEALEVVCERLAADRLDALRRQAQEVADRDADRAVADIE